MHAIRCWLLLVAALGVFAGGVSSKASPEPGYRAIRVHVTDVDGKPAAHRKLDLRGLERWSIEPGNEPGVERYWTFVTDAHGNARVRIYDFAGWLNEAIKPGWGVYAITVAPGPKDAGGVSSRVWYDNAPSHQNSDPRKDNWAMEWGPIVAVPNEGIDLPIHLERGFALRGRVVDEKHPDRPLKGVEIETHNDLRADTHTGQGGYILFNEAKTNGKGEFIFPHLFPQTVTIELRKPSIWLKTDLNPDGSWKGDAISSLDAPAAGNSMNLTIGAASAPQFRYFGKVLDETGKPMPHVTVEVYVISQPDATRATFEEDHGSQQTTAKDDGTYEFLSPTPWVIGIGAFDGSMKFSAYYQKESEQEVLPPGSYDLQLKPRSP